MLKRYWLVVFPDNKYGPQNFGVTAFSPEHAKSFVKETLSSIQWRHIPTDLVDKAEIIDNIDIGILDENHVLPNLGVVSRQGVWFSNCNS